MLTEYSRTDLVFMVYNAAPFVSDWMIKLNTWLDWKLSESGSYGDRSIINAHNKALRWLVKRPGTNWVKFFKKPMGTREVT